MIQFPLFRLPTVLALLALLGACEKQDAGTASQPAELRGSAPRVGISQAEQVLPKECVEAMDAHRACVENIAMSFERAGLVDGARELREALPAEVEEAYARWLTVPDREGVRLSCIAMLDAVRVQLQLQCPPQ